MASWQKCGDRVVRCHEHELVWVEAWGENGIRVRATMEAEMPDLPWALEQNCALPGQITVDGQDVLLTNGKLTCRMGVSGNISFWNQKGECLLQEQWRTNRPGIYPVSSLLLNARRFIPHRGGDWKLYAAFEAVKGEKIFGMGQYQDGILDRKGTVLELAQRNSQASVPFYMSSLGYGFLWNNPAVGQAAFGENGTQWMAESTKLMDYWITAGDTPQQIEQAYTGVTGRVPMMPEEGLGFWQCKLRYRTQDELMEVAREYHRRGVPVDVIVCDFFHWPYQGDWHFTPEEWPDPEGMVKELEEMGTRLMVSIWPMVDTRSENYAEMKDKGYITRTERGRPYTMDFHGNTIPMDVFHPDARKFVWDIVKKNYFDKGIELFWLDCAEPETQEYDYDNMRYHAGSALQVGNAYPALYEKLFYDGMTAAGRKQVLNLCRCAWAGSQKYGALVWSGDIDTTFRSLREQFASGLNMAISGIPWWTTDIGGFHGGDQDDPAYREVLIRWFQWGAFCPVFRLHGNRLHGESAPLPEQEGTGGPNEIWSYGEDAYAIMKDLILLRGRMRDYVREAMKRASETGEPVMKPLFYDFSEDAAAWEVTDQCLMGRDILVAPVMEAGMRQRQVYLPAGTAWVDAWTGKKYEGGCTVTAAAPLERTPVFLREGAAVEEAFLPMRG